METLGICLICTLQNAPDLIYSGWHTYRWDPPPRPPLRGRVGPGHHTPNSMPSPSLHPPLGFIVRYQNGNRTGV